MPRPDDTFWRTMFDDLDTGLIVLDSDSRVVGWNAWIASATRIPADVALSKGLEQLFPGSALRRLNAAIDEALSSGASSLLTHSLNPSLLPLKTRAGRTLIHDVSVRPTGSKSQQSCLVQFADVTLAVERERVLRERQNARYAAVVDNAPDAILTLNAEGLIQFANPPVRRELGYRPQELIGKSLSDLFGDKDAWTRTWRSLLAGNPLPGPVELAARRKDGSTSHIELSASHWLSESRIYVTVILRDVSERHAAEAALRHLNETLEERVASALAERKLLADIVETTDAFIQVVDLKFHLLAVNKASADEFERVFGMRPKVGDHLLQLLRHNPVEQAHAQRLWSRALTGEVFTVVHQFEDATSGIRFYELKFDSLRDGAGKLIAAFQFANDVTERLEHEAQLVRTEEALRQSQKMEAIGQLTGGIAHDFNNLLTGIIGAMELVKRRIASGRYEETQRFMDAAVTSANRAAALTHRLLAFARRQPLDPKSVDANQLIRGMDELFRRTLGEQIELKIDLAPNLWPTHCDENQLENALLNLVINARDAMPNGGSLIVFTENRIVSSVVREGQEEFEPGDYTVISVKDTGIGMSADVVSKVFDPFFTTKPIGQGTGLGLSMIYGFARQSNGQVDIESIVGKGTNVSLYLPRYRGDVAEEGELNSERALAGSGEAVLLVEDDSSVRLLIGEVLRELGYSCIEAVNSQTALPILSSNEKLDLMITDVGLPGMNGRQLAEVARKHRPDLKILFVTGYAEHTKRSERFLDQGMEFVIKPFTLEALALKVSDILSSKRSSSPKA